MVPKRVVSLVPSLTELVFWFGRGDLLVGRTRFCVAPAIEVGAIPIIGGTKNPEVERIVALEPDVVIANREENRREDVEALRGAGVEVVLTDPDTIDGALEMVADLGGLLGAGARADELIASTRTELSRPLPARRPRVFVAIWRHPLMGLGSQAYGHDLVERCGGENVLGDRPRYPSLSMEELPALRPDLILLPDEPYRFRESDRPGFDAIAPTVLLDGRLLWWYGPRMPGAIRRLGQIFEEAGTQR